MILDLTYVVIGLVLLVFSADKFIDYAALIAKLLGMSPLLVGVVIVGFGTSAPEMLVSGIAAYDGSPGIALGNAYGSNIVNIGLVLGITVIFYPLSVSSRIVKREIPMLLLMLIVSIIIFSDYNVSRIEGGVMVILAIAITLASALYANPKDALEVEFTEELESKPKTTLKVALPLLLVSLTVLLLSSKLLVMGAVNISKALGVSDLAIGLTVIAIGTSLPELAATILAARKNEPDIALGNITGSCLFNLLAVVGIAGTINPIQVDKIFLFRDFPFTVFLTLLLLILTFNIKKPSSISRRDGVILVIAYSIYMGVLVYTSMDSGAI